MRTPSLRRINFLLTIIVIVLAFYVILLPLLPALTWWARHDAPLVGRPPVISAVIPADNTLQIPKIGLNETIHEGGKYALHFGVWHRPNTSDPTHGSNTVLAGHRFTYHDPAVFYHLDKVQVGDEMSLWWQHKKYTYKIQRVLTVPPTATEVERPTTEPTLTVYTCTPLWSSKNRLVLIGRLES